MLRTNIETIESLLIKIRRLFSNELAFLARLLRSPNEIRNLKYIFKAGRRWPNPLYPAPSFSRRTLQFPPKRVKIIGNKKSQSWPNPASERAISASQQSFPVPE